MLQIFKALKEDVAKIAAQIEVAIAFLEPKEVPAVEESVATAEVPAESVSETPAQ